MRIVAGLETPDAGGVTLDGADLLPLPANRRPVNMVFQSYALFPHLNVFDNVAFGLRIRKFEGADVAGRVKSALSMLQLEPLAQRRRTSSPAASGSASPSPARWSMSRSCCSSTSRSRARCKTPRRVRVELRQLQRKLGTTFLLVTHDQDEAMTVSDRILLMKDGKIEQQGSPSEVYDHPVSRFSAEFLGAANLISAKRVDGGVETAFGKLCVARDVPWSEGTLAIRPERIRLASAAPLDTPGNRLRLRAKDVIYRGDHLDVFLEPGALRLSCEPSAKVRAGEEIWIDLPGRAPGGPA
jgi:spermidine/putrescine transport system ATP-binding protein